MPDTLKPKQKKTPRNYDSITKGALSLPLEERVNIRDRLTTSINVELKEMRERFESASKLVNGDKE